MIPKIEYGLSEELSDEYVAGHADLEDVYFQEISKIPVLSAEEQMSCGHAIKAGKDSKVVTRINNNPVLSLDFAKLFLSLENSKHKDIIMSTLIDYYKKEKREGHDKFLKYLNKYQELCLRMDKSPDALVLSGEFPELNFNVEKIAEEELLYEVKVYLQYVIAYYKMLNSNLRLVVSVAKPYMKYSQIPTLDLIQEGNIGLMTAIDRFDVSRGCKFSTYATCWILSAVTDCVYANISAFSVPRYVLEITGKMVKEIEKMHQKGDYKSVEELAKIYHKHKKTMLACLKHVADGAISDSLMVGNGEGEEAPVSELIYDDGLSVEDEICYRQLPEDIMFLFDGLRPREIDVIDMRFGITDRRHSLDEVAAKYNISRERVRQIEDGALKKMRKIATQTKRGRALKAYIQ